ncbi:toxin-antitoxin system HicB family antitoxin [Alicyclobacillus sp. SO9]|uniref:toxin-antitoxin system HicB family antitoxin n=1 Tax=Alicyclobacillus sp. SO9 TaxID=2665646 RepID=UPI0018E7A65A|nr:toxin-antitoxin system HicB family antitoxin [Alicyclobacillus sp. SO9]QQE78921.1 toxin-antitoxin system HicB family antitoxin [Alicyclobacillus sp. SO9]
MGKKQYPLRLDAEVYKAIERWANDEFRSVNAHIEFLLRDALKRGGRLPKHDGQPPQSSTERNREEQ